MKTKTIRRKLLLLTLLPPLVLLVVILGYFIHQDYRLMRGALLERGETMSRYLATAAEYGVITGNTEQLATISASVVQGDIVALEVLDFDEKPIFSNGKQVGGPERHGEPGAGGVCGGSEDYLLFCAPILLQSMPVSDYETAAEAGASNIGHIELTLSTQAVRIKRATMLRWALLLVLAVVGLALLLSRRVERQLVGPLSVLGQVVERVRRGDLQVQVSELASGELLALQQGVNSMIDALANSQQHMQREIDSATGELRNALQQLELRNRQLQQEQQRAESASLAKSQFLATMSHEIRTPLSGMIGMLQLLRDGSADRQQQDHIDSLEGAAQSLRQLIDDILDFSRLEVGKLAIKNQPFDPLAVIEEVMVMLTPSAHHKGLEFVLDVDGGLPSEVVGDPLRFRQVLINLTANAIKFTHEGEVVVRVRPTRGDEGCRFRFEISDTGIGISAQNQGLVFESFTQIDEGDARSYGGSGLGATISRELVQMMRGDIGLESEPGRGSCFWFELPWQCSRETEQGGTQSAEASVLLLESHPASASAIVSLLQNQGVATNHVADEEELWRALSSGEYRWVVVAEKSPASPRRELLQRLARELPAQMRLVQLGFVNGVRAEGERIEHLTKPLLPSVMSKLLLKVEPAHADEAGDDSPSLSVLLAEDDDINARVITHFLGLGGHRVERVIDGEAALEALRGGQFDCVLMDLRMPGLDGLAATRLWRTEEEGHLPIIALTANASEEDRQRCREVGMDDYLTKPVERKSLLATLQRHCN